MQDSTFSLLPVLVQLLRLNILIVADLGCEIVLNASLTKVIRHLRSQDSDPGGTSVIGGTHEGTRLLIMSCTRFVKLALLEKLATYLSEKTCWFASILALSASSSPSSAHLGLTGEVRRWVVTSIPFEAGDFE
jgi:hypothetical protein